MAVVEQQGRFLIGTILCIVSSSLGISKSYCNSAAVIGCRDVNWAHGNSAVTNVLFLSTVWVVGAGFCQSEYSGLGGILNQQGVGSST